MEIMGLVLLILLYKYLDSPSAENSPVVEYIDEYEEYYPNEEVVTSA